MVRLEGTLLWDVDVFGLLGGEDSQVGTQLGEMEAGDLFVELLGESVDAELVVVLPEGDLGEGLVGEAVGHDEAGVSSGASKVDESSFGEQDDGGSVGENVLVDLGLDVDLLDSGVGVESSDVDFSIEVANVANDGILSHLGHVLNGDDVAVSGGGNVDLGDGENLLEGLDFESSHAGLESADGVDFSDDNAGSLSAEGFSTSLSDISVTGDDGDLSGKHDVGGAVDGVDQRVTATVDVIELGLGDRVVNVDGGEEEGSFLHHLVESVDTSGGFLRNSLNVGDDLVEVSGVLLEDALEEGVDDLEFRVSFIVFQDGGVVLSGVTTVDEEGSITTIVDDEFGSLFSGEEDGSPGAFPVVFQVLSLPGEDGGSSGSDGSSSVVLGAVDVAAAPADVSTDGLEGFDQHCGLDGHVERASDADVLEGLLGSVLFSGGHESGHFVLSELDFLATEVSLADIGDLVVILASGEGDGGGLSGHVYC